MFSKEVGFVSIPVKRSTSFQLLRRFPGPRTAAVDLTASGVALALSSQYLEILLTMPTNDKFDGAGRREARRSADDADDIMSAISVPIACSQVRARFDLVVWL